MEFSYLLLDALVIFMLWKVFSAFSQLFKPLQQTETRTCATRLQGPSHMTKVLTPLTEPEDWSRYDTPTYLRKGIVVH